MNKKQNPLENDKGLRAVGMVDTLIELILGAGIMIVFAIILFVYARTNFNMPSVTTGVNAVFKMPVGKNHHYQAGQLL